MARFELVCGLEYLRPISQTLFFTGTMVGALACGPLSDRLGRKVVYLGGLALNAVFGLAAGFLASAAGVYVWIGCRFVCGAAAMAMNLAANVYFIEIVGGKVVSATAEIF